MVWVGCVLAYAFKWGMDPVLLVWLIMVPAILSLGLSIYRTGWTVSRKVGAGLLVFAGSLLLEEMLTS